LLSKKITSCESEIENRIAYLSITMETLILRGKFINSDRIFIDEGVDDIFNPKSEKLWPI
jgi:hypothetical protein